MLLQIEADPDEVVAVLYQEDLCGGGKIDLPQKPRHPAVQNHKPEDEKTVCDQ